MAVVLSSSLSLIAEFPVHPSCRQADVKLSSNHAFSRTSQAFLRSCRCSIRITLSASLDSFVLCTPVAGLGTLDPNSGDDDEEGRSRDGDASGSESDSDGSDFKSRMERMMGTADDNFRGKDLATLIRNKYGRSYDVQFIRKEFLGKSILAMNVMWKYREQKSFPLTEEEYIYHLDNIADNLRYWGAVSTVRTSLEKTKEKPRIGKAGVPVNGLIDDKGGVESFSYGFDFGSRV